MLPKITVITPSFNQGAFIEETIRSVIGQNYPSLEYIVIDGGSSDQTLSILHRYSTQLKLVSEPDRGQTDAINKGLRMATGDIVCWLNSDDYFMPGTLEYVDRFFDAHPDCTWLSGDCQIVDQTGQQIQKLIRYYKRLLRYLSPAFYLGLTNAICQPATFWRRSVHEELGFLDESLRYTMDYDWWLRLKKIQKPIITNRTLTAFRIHPDSKGGSEFDKQFIEDYQVFSRYQLGKIPGILHRLHNKLITGAYALIK